jgi:SAM-dependent methyltransferase
MNRRFSDQVLPDTYEILDTPWARDRALLRTTNDENANKELLVIDQYHAVEFRDDLGELYHRYDLSAGAQGLSHYFRYWGTGFFDFSHTQIKFRFLFGFLFLLRKLAKHRSVISILELGGTIGENYLMLKEALAYENSPITVEYTVLDISENIVALGRELHSADPNFQIVIGDGSNLSRFPNDSFDLVVSNSVPNYLTDAAAGYREAHRVARVGSLFHTMVPPEGASATLSGASASLRYKLLTISEIKEILSDRECNYLYNINKFWAHNLNVKREENSDGVFMEDIDQKHLRWMLLIFSKYQLFPENSAFEE